MFEAYNFIKNYIIKQTILDTLIYQMFSFLLGYTGNQLLFNKIIIRLKDYLLLLYTFFQLILLRLIILMYD